MFLFMYNGTLIKKKLKPKKKPKIGWLRKKGQVRDEKVGGNHKLKERVGWLDTH